MWHTALVPRPMRAAAAAAGWRRAARCVRTATHRGDTARPFRAVTASSSVARHVRMRMPHQQPALQARQKRTKDSKREACNCSSYWQLLLHASRIRTDVVLTLHVLCVGPGQSFRNCYDRAARLKYICCASVVRTLNATRPVHMLTKTRPMSSPRIITPPKFRGSLLTNQP